MKKHPFIGLRVAVTHPDDDTEVLYYGTMVAYKAPVAVIKGKPGDIRQEHECAVWLADDSHEMCGTSAADGANEMQHE